MYIVNAEKSQRQLNVTKACINNIKDTKNYNKESYTFYKIHIHSSEDLAARYILHSF